MASSVRAVDRDSDSRKDFELTFSDGEVLRLSDLKGTVVVVNFWGSWCPPCRWEMPYFEGICREHRDQGVVFIGIAVPHPDTEEDARAFAEKVGITYPLGLDATGEVMVEFGITQFPSTLIFNREGDLARRFGLANEGVLRVYLRGQL